jgi:hypothetical protein
MIISNSKDFVMSSEVLNYPYCGDIIESKVYLSEKICYSNIRLIRRAKFLFRYVDFIYTLSNGLLSSQAIGLAILRPTESIMRPSSYYIDSDAKKKLIISKVSQNKPETSLFTEKQMEQFYNLAIKYQNKSLTTEQLIFEIRGGDLQKSLQKSVAIFGIVLGMGLLINNLGSISVDGVDAFLMIAGVPPQQLQLFYKIWGERDPNQQARNNFNFAYGNGPRQRSISVRQNQNAGSDEPSSSSYRSSASHPYDYRDIKNQLAKQSHKRKIRIEIGDQTYTIQNRDNLHLAELESLLAEKIYDWIRESNTDVNDIASNMKWSRNLVQ